MSKKLSIVVPVYFNEGSLPLIFERLTSVERDLESIGMTLELIFVDDGSKDGSLTELLNIKRARPATTVVKLTRNFGAVHASKCGFRFVSGDCFMALAADLQDPPEMILQMVEKWQSGCKFVICQRVSRDDPLTSRVFAKLFYWLVHKLVMNDYPDGGYDVGLMDKALLPHMINSSKSLYTPLLAYWLGYKAEAIPYHRAERKYGRSQWTLRKKFKAFLDVMLGFSVAPIRLISAFGAVVAFLSFGYGVLVVGNAVFGKAHVPGFTSLVALITFLLGLVIIMLGIIGEYLWRVFEELNKRPEVVIEEIY